MSRHLTIGILFFILSIAIIIVYTIAAFAPAILAAPFGITTDRLQFMLVFIPVSLAMIGVSIGISYVGYSIIKEAQERKAVEPEREAKR
ncbi:MAG: hypothetical protein ACUVTL_08560 [Thermoproteota archaeon]